MKYRKITIAILLVLVSVLVLQWHRLSILQAKQQVHLQTPDGLQPVQLFSFDLPYEIWFAGERIPLEMFYIAENLERELIVNTYWHSSTMLLLKRAGRWLPVIEPILEEQGVPNDLKYLCMIESNLTNIRSPAGAVGFWQFMESTAKEYGLEVNTNVDERYHLEKATRAACRYFKKAYDKYGSWALVAAAYNAGTKRIDGFLSEQQASSYFDLLMAEETERYLFRMIAIKMIMNDPDKYGFYPLAEPQYQPLKWRTMLVVESIPNLAEFAWSQGISYKLLKYFNPWLRSNQLPVSSGKSYEIKIPIAPFNLTHQEVQTILLNTDQEAVPIKPEIPVYDR